jgi:phosphate starvation-inducible PhoH-like protein
LTRLGYNSKAVVTGDLSQTDLPVGKRSGLSIASRVLRGIDGISIFEFSDRDVVRHHLVRKIINAYEKYEREEATERESKRYRVKKNDRRDG